MLHFGLALASAVDCKPFFMLLFCTLIQGLVTEDPNCVVLGDAVDGFSYKNLNTAFRLRFLVYLVHLINRPF
jgi:hypothetical protein